MRPMNEKERGNNDPIAVQTFEGDMQRLQVSATGPKGALMTRGFTFHGCLGPPSRQQDVLKMCGITQLLDAAMAGYHVTIFAYGQTGSGKTYTMSGVEDIIGNDDYAGETLILEKT